MRRRVLGRIWLLPIKPQIGKPCYQAEAASVGTCAERRYQPRRVLRVVGCMRLLGGRLASMRRFISSSEMVRPRANSARERAMSSRNSGCWLSARDSRSTFFNGTGRDRAIALGQDDGFVPEIGNVVRERSNSR